MDNSTSTGQLFPWAMLGIALPKAFAGDPVTAGNILTAVVISMVLSVFFNTVEAIIKDR